MGLPSRPANQTQKHLPLELENASVSAFLNFGSLLKLFKQHWASRTGHQHIGAERGWKRKTHCTQTVHAKEKYIKNQA